jgi:Periplasmic binding protein domain
MLAHHGPEPAPSRPVGARVKRSRSERVTLTTPLGLSCPQQRIRHAGQASGPDGQVPTRAPNARPELLCAREARPPENGTYRARGRGHAQLGRLGRGHGPRDRVNARGGLIGREVELICVDDKSDAATVAGICEEFLSRERLDLLLGGYGNNSITPPCRS